ncbi:hypothetical protein ACFV2I_34010 [Streptomyces microflavus]|uniref:hypothetical protein n=1 Tax=Streptomyces TaxID=1883 RepID=UPI00131C9EC2|nr:MULTISPECIES: hypothetical protein [unclassified Streptomyces]
MVRTLYRLRPFAPGFGPRPRSPGRGGDKPVLYFATNVDKWYGFEISKTEQATSRRLP